MSIQYVFYMEGNINASLMIEHLCHNYLHVLKLIKTFSLLGNTDINGILIVLWSLLAQPSFIIRYISKYILTHIGVDIIPNWV